MARRDRGGRWGMVLIGLALAGPARARGADDAALPPGVREVPSDTKPAAGVGRRTALLRGDAVVGIRTYDGRMALVEEHLYRAGRLDGPRRRWFADGKPRSLVTFKDGVPDGPAEAWDDAGRPLWRRNMVRGSGVLKTFHDDGTPESECPYRAGLKHGVERRWHPNGCLAVDSTYDAGQPDGASRAYFSDGQLQSESFARAGQLHGVHRVWDRSGRLVNVYDRAPEDTPADYPDRAATPHYYVLGRRVTPAEYDRAAATDPDLRRHRGDDSATGTIRPDTIPTDPDAAPSPSPPR